MNTHQSLFANHKLFFGLAFLAILGCSQSPTGTDWHSATSTDDRISALFPETPVHEKGKTATGDCPFEEWHCWHNGARFSIGAMDQCHYEIVSLDAFFDAAAENIASLGDGRVVENVPLERNGIHGRKHVVMTSSGVYASYMFFIDGTMYDAKIVGADLDFDLLTHRYFFDNVDIHR